MLRSSFLIQVFRDDFDSSFSFIIIEFSWSSNWMEASICWGKELWSAESTSGRQQKSAARFCDEKSSADLYFLWWGRHVRAAREKRKKRKKHQQGPILKVKFIDHWILHRKYSLKLYLHVSYSLSIKSYEGFSKLCIIYNEHSQNRAVIKIEIS